MTFSVIRLELAREKDFPSGSPLHGYEIVAPLDDTGHLDASEWKKNRSRCTVRRFWDGEEDRHGELVHSTKYQWAISYDPTTELDDEPIFRLDRHNLTLGNYVSITEPDRTQHTYRVASIAAADDRP